MYAALTQLKPTACEVVLGELPAWGINSLERFKRELNAGAAPFPCTFAVSAFHRAHLRFAFVDSLRDETSWSALPRLLADYVTTVPVIVRVTSFVVFFRLDSGDERRELDWYQDRFWSVLSFLHEHDPSPWPADLPQDPDDPRWEFAFAGQPIFVVCNAPAYRQRRSRRSSELMITFQPRSVFEGLEAGSVRGQAARRTIRKRLARYDAPLLPSSDLGGYGQTGNREWKQYFLRDSNDDPGPPRCPFQTAG
jgi:FPC/CPF motif-containing protein YcgG